MDQYAIVPYVNETRIALPDSGPIPLPYIIETSIVLYNPVIAALLENPEFYGVPPASPENLSLLTEISTDESCPVCTDEIEVGLSMPCGHVYHEFCITSWLLIHNSCPICRRAVN